MSLASFIPERISNSMVMSLYQVLTWIRVPGFIRKKNYVHNLEWLGKTEGKIWNPEGYTVQAFPIGQLMKRWDIFPSIIRS